MQTQEVHFTVTKQDFRAANYYIYFLRRILLLRLAVAALIVFVVYMILVQFGVFEFWIPSGYIASAIIFWLLWHMTRIEQTVRRYARSKDNILNLKSILRFSDSRMTIKVPEKAFNSSGLFAEFPCAFETRSAFLVYTSGSDLFLIPRRAFSDKQKELFREILIRVMGDRFSSKYNKNAPHIPTAAEQSAEAARIEKEEQKAAAEQAEKAHKRAIKEAKKEGRDLLAEEEKAAEEAGAVIGPNYRPRRRSIADRANLVNNRGKNAEKKHS